MKDAEASVRLRVFAAYRAGMTGDESREETAAFARCLPSDERDVITRLGLESLIEKWLVSLLPSRRSALQRAGPKAVADAFVADLATQVRSRQRSS